MTKRMALTAFLFALSTTTASAQTSKPLPVVEVLPVCVNVFVLGATPACNTKKTELLVTTVDPVKSLAGVTYVGTIHGSTWTDRINNLVERTEERKDTIATQSGVGPTATPPTK